MALATDTPVESPTDAPVEMMPTDAPVAMPTDAPTVVAEVCNATGWGDPHFVTFDGFKYDCQADSEVVLVKSLDSDFKIQGRFTTAGFPTVTIGIVMREQGGLPIVQISMATLTGAPTTDVGGCPVETGASAFSFEPAFD
jgi:hypothetical protein